MTAGGIISDGHNDNADIFRAFFADKVLQALDIHIAFEGVNRFRVMRFRNYKINRFGFAETDMSPCSIKVHIRNRILSCLEQAGIKNFFSRSALMYRLHVAILENVSNRISDLIVAGGSGITLISHHYTRPLHIAHGIGSAISQKINIDILAG